MAVTIKILQKERRRFSYELKKRIFKIERLLCISLFYDNRICYANNTKFQSVIMAKRVAFFAGKETVENFFKLESNRDNLFEPHYNLSVGHHIPMVHKSGDKRVIKRVRWGDEKTHETSVNSEMAIELIGKKEFVSCAVPLSGFYVWKDDKEKGSPFFIRMINAPLMVAAGVYSEKADYFKLITMPSNVLINPMSETMPVLLDRELSFSWLEAEKKDEANELIDKAKNLFLLTDISVLRVSEKVNDPSSNDEKLIQPIPK